jgi:hypothetical protein
MDHEKLRQYLDDNREPEGKGIMIFIAFVLLSAAVICGALIWKSCDKQEVQYEINTNR